VYQVRSSHDAQRATAEVLKDEGVALLGESPIHTRGPVTGRDPEKYTKMLNDMHTIKKTKASFLPVQKRGLNGF